MKKLLFPLLFVVGSAACSPRTIALRQTSGLIHDGLSALYEEQDPQLAKEALPGNLMLVETLLRSEPGNPELLETLAKGYNGYAFIFLEDEAPQRAKGLYLRGRDEGLRLAARNPKLAKLLDADLAAAQEALKSATKDDAPALFWAGFGWASYINLSKDDPAALSELPKAVALMQRVKELDPDYHFAGSDLFFGMYYGSRPAILGGDLKKSGAAFQEARRRTGGKYLLTYVLEARTYAVAAQDQELFKSLLNKVLESPAGQLPNARLADEAAKLKAKKLLEKADDLF